MQPTNRFSVVVVKQDAPIAKSFLHSYAAWIYRVSKDGLNNYISFKLVLGGEW